MHRVEVSCPQPRNTSCLVDDRGWQIGHYHAIPVWTGLVSSLLSVLGCVLMLISYQRYRDFRTGSRRVATWLSVFNLLLAVGYALGSLNFIVYQYSEGENYCSWFSYICAAQAFVTWSSALASFIWMVILALYLFLALVKRTINTANHWVTWITYYVVSIAVPLATMLVIAGFQHLGYSPYATGGSCFVSTWLNKSVNGSDVYGFRATNVSLISLVKGLEVVSYVIVVFVFGVIQFKISTLPCVEQVRIAKPMHSFKYISYTSSFLKLYFSLNDKGSFFRLYSPGFSRRLFVRSLTEKRVEVTGDTHFLHLSSHVGDHFNGGVHGSVLRRQH